VLQKAVSLAQTYATSIPPIMKQAASLDSINKRKAQEGQAKFSIRGHKIFARINTIPTSHGEKITLRISNKILKFISLDEIGMSNHDLVRLRQLLMQPDAIILFVGPSGCGKTTTMYAVLNELKDDEKNIATIENPIESLIDGINQTSAGSDRDISFIEGVRSLFHHDVDVMGVGEIRNKETAELMIEAGFTGMLAVSTVQSSDAIKSLFRLKNLGINREDLSLAVRGIVAQRFVRIACPHCAESVKPDRDTLELAGLLNLPERISLKRAKGCKACLNNGYINRLPIFETLLINEDISNLIHKGSSYVEIKKAAEDAGFTTMRYDGLRKALAGITTLEEVIRVT
jgi:type II secretory ATPase GspE/PulE/Tfp pilus assembly ATPase PilB-like protein